MLPFLLSGICCFLTHCRYGRYILMGRIKRTLHMTVLLRKMHYTRRGGRRTAKKKIKFCGVDTVLQQS